MNSETKKLLIIDLTKVAVIAITYHLLFALRASQRIITESFLYDLSFFLCGVVVYYVLVHKHVANKTEKMNN